MWALQDRSEERRCEQRSGGGVKSANPLTGFKRSRHHQWPVGGVKAARSDMANLGPRAARWSRARWRQQEDMIPQRLMEASAPVVMLD